MDFDWRRNRSLTRCAHGSCEHVVQTQFMHTVDSTGDVGRSAEFGFDRDYDPHIVYLDETHGTVKYARRFPSQRQRVSISPSRWSFGRPGDWRAFFVDGKGSGEIRVRDIRIECPGPGRAEDWVLDTACDLDFGEVLGGDLLTRSRASTPAVCVEVAPDAIGPARAELVVETSAGTVRSQLFYGLFGTDADGDGIDDAEEESGGGDRNSDGVPDGEQDHVATLRGMDGWSHLSVASPRGTELRDVDVMANPSPEDAPPGIEFPFGFLSFRVIDLAPGDAVVVEVHLPAGWSMETYWKYGPTPAEPTPHWYEFSYDGVTGAEFAGDAIGLHFVDGLRGDDDLSANGTIVDPGAPARSRLPVDSFNLTAPRLLSDGRFECLFAGPPGTSYRVQSSPNLLPGSWTDLTNFVHDTPTRVIVDSDNGGDRHRFYRALRQ